MRKKNIQKSHTNTRNGGGRGNIGQSLSNSRIYCWPNGNTAKLPEREQHKKHSLTRTKCSFIWQKFSVANCLYEQKSKNSANKTFKNGKKSCYFSTDWLFSFFFRLYFFSPAADCLNRNQCFNLIFFSLKHFSVRWVFRYFHLSNA